MVRRRLLREAAMFLLDLFYLAIALLSIALSWLFVKACDRL